ncbi:LOW QUALITY PROTEIN: inositol 1,4,5-trisphosphate receptor-interacting protein-like 1 [Mycteria americana]|uniref:LOW QUALITY PROTEIN: inositol 1,4,5-trisphosphate receptor-interacting protein-like 1 n=1 Tax=Mycteria americana TaxID=33587 RepID=UPI003F588285
MERPHPTTRIYATPTHRCHKGTKSTAMSTSTEVSTKGANPISRDGISRSKASMGSRHLILCLGPAARGNALGRTRCRRCRGWHRPCCLPAASPPLLPAPSSLRLPSPFPPTASSPPPSPTELLLSLLLQAMAATKFLALVVLSIIQYPQMVGGELDEATRERVQQHADNLSQEMTRLLQELELRSQEQSGVDWGALLFAALQQWQFWAIAGVLVLPFGLWWWLSKRSPEPDSSSDEESSSSNTDQEEEEDDSDDANDLGRFFEEHIQWPVQDLATECRVVKAVVADLIRVCQVLLSNSFFPVLQPAIGVGSAFEGWSPREEDIIYRLLVPLQPPRGHAFHLELGTAREMLARNFCIRVELECTCTRERPAGEMLCFLHHPEEELRRNQDPSLLGTLCTGSYLDVQKTARWFQILVKAAWVVLPESAQCRLTVLPSSRSCKFRVTKGNNKSLCIEMMFGVQQGDSDIFLSSQSTEAIFTPSTMWTESCAVAEVKFFRHVARQAPHDSFHLRCLQVCARILVGTGFSTYTLKTVVMHLLTTIPLSGWRGRDFLLRLQDIMRYLRCCLEEKRLDHFFFGNERVPEEISLPPDFRTVEPLNLFQRLVQHPATHAEALREFVELRDRLTRLLIYGR